MQLLVLGGSGGCGRWIVQLADRRGYDVRTVVREGASFRVPKRVEVIRGNVLDENVLRSALAGCDAVLSALGIKRKNPANPWSQLVSPDDLTAHVAGMLVRLMPVANINRFVGISAAGVGDSNKSVNPVIRWMISHSNMKAAYEDLENMESVLELNTLDWMAVRPVTLRNGTPTGQAKSTGYYGLKNFITRGDVAKWMLDALEQEGPFSDRTPMISY